MNKEQTSGLLAPHLNALNISSNQIQSPWAADEHQRFLLALEQFGGGQCSSVGDTWRSIATAIGTRTISHVVYHARLYFAQLQQLNAHEHQERLSKQGLDQRWTPEDDATLENMLAAFSTSSVYYPWEVMASRLPGKSPGDLKERYQKLCCDVARIERGQTRTAAIGESRRLSSPRVLDSVIILTPAEEQLLMNAMADVFVPPEAPANLLAGIALAVAPLTNSNGRLPPQRTRPLFTKEQALEVLNGLLKNKQTDPRVVLETLAIQLRLHPQALNIAAGVSFSSSATTALESSDPLQRLV